MHRKVFVGRNPWAILAVATMAQTVSALVGLATLPLAPFIRADLGISRAQVGLLVSATYVGAAVVSVPAGLLTDALGVRVMVTASQLAIGLGVFLFSMAPSYSWILLAMPLIGLGYGAFNPGTGKAVIDWFSGRLRGSAMGIRQTGFALGGALGAAVLPGLAILHSWRTALLVASGVALASGAIFWGVYRDRSVGTQSRLADSPMRKVRQLMTNRDLATVAASGFLFSGTQLIVVSYLMLFLHEVARVPLVQAGALLAVTQISGVAGRIGSGVMSDRLLGGRRKAPLMAMGLGSSLAAGVFSAVGPGWPAPALIAIAALLGATAVGWNALYNVMVAETVAPEQVGVAVGLGTTANYVGVVFLPPLFGLLVDVAHSYALAWRVVALAALCNSLLLLMARDKYSRRGRSQPATRGG